MSFIIPAADSSNSRRDDKLRQSLLWETTTAAPSNIFTVGVNAQWCKFFFGCVIREFCQKDPLLSYCRLYLRHSLVQRFENYLMLNLLVVMRKLCWKKSFKNHRYSIRLRVKAMSRERELAQNAILKPKLCIFWFYDGKNRQRNRVLNLKTFCQWCDMS